MDNSKQRNNLRLIFIIWGILSFIVLLLVLFFPALMTQVTHFHDDVSYGEYGDIYGGLNTLFTGLAFIGLLVTISFQHLELTETRNEFVKQTKQFENQTDILKEQLNEQKSFNEEQLYIAATSQNKEELLKRIDIIKNIQDDVCIDILKAKYHPSIKWYFENLKTLQGEAAFERIFHRATDIICAVNNGSELSEHEKQQIICEAKAIYASLNKLNAWLYSINDYLRDVPQYFHRNPEAIGTYYRMLFNSMSKYNKAILLINAGITIPSEHVDICLKKGYIDKENVVLPVHLDPIARLLLLKVINLDMSVDVARSEWQQYLQETGKKFDLYEYKV